jgi:hypothetical protein
VNPRFKNKNAEKKWIFIGEGVQNKCPPLHIIFLAKYLKNKLVKYFLAKRGFS